MIQQRKTRIQKSTLIFLGVMFLISLAFFSASYFFGLTFLFPPYGWIFIIPYIPYLIVSLIYWIIQPIALWKKPFIIITTTLIGAITGYFLVFSTVILPGTKNHEYVMYNVCYPALRKYYNVDDLSKMPPRAIDAGKNGSTRWFAQHSECEDNYYKGKGPIFSENPAGFGNKPSPNPIPTPAQDATANWKTYAYTKYGFSFKYPTDWTLKDKLSMYNNPDMLIAQVFNDDNEPEIKGKEVEILLSKSVDIERIKRATSSGDAGMGSTSKVTTKNIDGREIVVIERNYFWHQQGGGTLDKGTQYFIYIPVKDNYLSLRSDISNKKTLDQILSTFKFTNHAGQNSAKYFTIDYWKVRLSIKENLANLKTLPPEASIYSSTGQMVKILAPELDKHWLCSGDTGATIGSISRTTEEVRSGPYKPLATKRIGNYTYGYEATPTSNCTTDPKYPELVKEFTSAFNSIESY